MSQSSDVLPPFPLSPDIIMKFLDLYLFFTFYKSKNVFSFQTDNIARLFWALDFQ